MNPDLDKKTVQLVSQLVSTRDETLRYFELGEEDLDKHYAPGKWNVRQILHHLADAETVLYDRIRRGIANPGQVVWGFDQDAWAVNLNYRYRSLELNRDIYSAVRAQVMVLAKEHYAQLADNPLVHSRTGSRTLGEIFEKVAWHNADHLEQIRRALGK